MRNSKAQAQEYPEEIHAKDLSIDSGPVAVGRGRIRAIEHLGKLAELDDTEREPDHDSTRSEHESKQSDTDNAEPKHQSDDDFTGPERKPDRRKPGRDVRTDHDSRLPERIEGKLHADRPIGKVVPAQRRR